MFRQQNSHPPMWPRFAWSLWGILGAGRLLVPSEASAATLRVPSEYPTIQAAVDASAEGDSVLVAPGTYRGPGNRSIHFPGHSLVMTSEGGAEVTILDIEGSASDPGRGFLLDHGEGPETILEGFTIENGWMSTEETRPAPGDRSGRSGPAGSVYGPVPGGSAYGAGGAGGAGALASGAARHDLSGAGFKVNFGSPRIRDLIIRRCHSEYTGGGASVEAVASPSLSNILISNCSAGIQGGGISIETGSTAHLENCVFVGNAAPLGGGLANHANVVLVGCTIAANRAEFGGGVALYTYAEGNYERTLIWGNCATEQGDEIWSDNGASALTLTCCLVDSSGAFEYNPGTIEWGNSVFSDPLFCAPKQCLEAPFEGGDFSLSTQSPALPVRSPCGALVGALEYGPCNLSPVRSVGWGGIKARFLGEGNDP